MRIDRRKFLRFAGLSTLLGFTGISVINELLRGGAEAATFTSNPASMSAKRWAMVIDMNKLKTEADYRKVINACHSIHNVPELDNKKHEIKWIWTEKHEHVFPGQSDEYVMDSLKHQPFMVLCNHCANPPCVRVCPTKATFKRKDGIVMMDYHRCIGCRFCMAACPFGARSFNWKAPRPFIKDLNAKFPTRTKGVVEKCNFCAERLAKGLKPACVEASNGAFAFGDLQDPGSEVRKILSSRYAIRRKPELGTGPSVYYVIGGNDHA